MKMKSFITAIIISSFLIFEGCILEDFETIPINIPISLPIIIPDNPGTNITAEANFSIDTSQIYKDYQGDIKNLRLSEIAFRFLNVKPADLMGNMHFVMKKGGENGIILVDETITDFLPDNYTTPDKQPYIITLVAGADLLNAADQFYGSVTIENITPQNSIKSLTGYLDMLFKAEVEF